MSIVCMMLITIVSVASSEAVDSPIILTTIDYQEMEYILIESNNGEIDLNYVSSDSFGPDAITLEKTDYYPSTNETKYRVTSNNINPCFYDTADTKDFIYQDVNTGQLYIIIVDYTGIEIPTYVFETMYYDLHENYSDLYHDNNELQDNYDNLTSLSEYINSSINNVINNSENYSLSEKTDLLIDEYESLKNGMNNTENDYFNLKNSYDVLISQLDNNTVNLSNMTDRYLDLKMEYEELNISNMINYSKMFDYSSELSEYKLFYDKTQAFQDSFYWDDTSYRTFYSYQNEIESLKGDIGMIPIYIAIAVLTTALIAYLLSYRRIYELKQPFKQELGHSEEAQSYTKYLASRIHDTFNVRNPLRKKEVEQVENVERIVDKIDSEKKTDVSKEKKE